MADASQNVERQSKHSIFQSYLSRAAKYGGATIALTDGDGREITHKEIIRAAFALGGALARHTDKKEHVGILLPTSAGALIAFFSVLSRGRVPAMLNFTSGVANILAACKAAKVTRIITAHKFIEVADLHKLMEELSASVEILYLEDVREEITARDKALAILGPIFPKLLAADPHYDDPGVYLFTSGTEGQPKGVVLSHRNIMANITQISEHVELLPTDIFFNPLPTFHCYGLTGGALWPLMNGHGLVLHPSPLQTKIIPKRIMETRSSVLFATDTFLSQYMRASKDGDMSSIRIAVCGAERVRDETRQAAEKRFGFEVLEGYGVTEGSPVVAVNQPGDIRAGTVGTLLPGIEHRIEPVEGLDNAGRLIIKGPNIMKGYVTADDPDTITPPPDGWHDTGDIVAIDEHGYVSIRGRLKRFAKIGGEMVSLAVVENCASAVWPDNLHAAAILPDPRKGEQIVLVTDRKTAPRELLLSWAQSHGVPEIAVPKKIVTVDEVPVLGTGKIDFLKVKTLAEDAIGAINQPAAPSVEPTILEAAAEDESDGSEAASPADEDALDKSAGSAPQPAETPQANDDAPPADQNAKAGSEEETPRKDAAE